MTLPPISDAQCALCRERVEVRFEARDPLTRKGFSIVACTACGLGRTLPAPQDLARYYPARYYGNRHGFTARHCVRRRLGLVAAATQGMPPGRTLLDIGCGDGAFLIAARAAGWDVAGSELQPEPARKRGLNVQTSLDRLDGPFDCITMWHVLEHLPDPAQRLAQVAGLLVPGGTLLVAVPDFGGLQARLFGRHWLHADVPRHLYHFTRVALEGGLRQAGLEVARRWHQEFEYDALGWSQSALNALLPEPNVFFDLLTGRRPRGGRLLAWSGAALGVALTALALPAVALGTLVGRGGTLMVAARRAQHKQDCQVRQECIAA